MATVKVSPLASDAHFPAENKLDGHTVARGSSPSSRVAFAFDPLWTPESAGPASRCAKGGLDLYLRLRDL